jgi:hypothetical protein
MLPTTTGAPVSLLEIDADDPVADVSSLLPLDEQADPATASTPKAATRTAIFRWRR